MMHVLPRNDSTSQRTTAGDAYVQDKIMRLYLQALVEAQTMRVRRVAERLPKLLV